jgi:hypothetical protein
VRLRGFGALAGFAVGGVDCGTPTPGSWLWGGASGCARSRPSQAGVCTSTPLRCTGFGAALNSPACAFPVPSRLSTRPWLMVNRCADLRSTAQVNGHPWRVWEVLVDRGTITGLRRDRPPRFVKAAAADPAVSESAVSIHLAHLRGELGDKLFARTANGLAFTPGGLRLASRAAELLGLRDRTILEVRQAGSGRRPLRGAASRLFAEHAAPGLMELFAGRADDLDVEPSVHSPQKFAPCCSPAPSTWPSDPAPPPSTPPWPARTSFGAGTCIPQFPCLARPLAGRPGAVSGPHWAPGGQGCQRLVNRSRRKLPAPGRRAGRRGSPRTARRRGFR